MEFAPPYNNVAWLLAREGKNFDESIKMAKRAIQLDPQYAEAYDTLGWSYVLSGHFDDAIEALNTAKKIGGEKPAVLGHLGTAYYKKGMKKEALLNYKRALAIDKEASDAPTLRKIIAELEKQ
jgi:tetratricopeptide (TPR) repeat protein